MGGTVSFLAGARRRLGAAVSFYGGGVAEGRFGMPPLVELAPSLQTPWLGLYGDQDPSIPVEQAEALREAAGRASVPTELVRYPEAGHGFHCDDRPSAYHEASAADAWSRTLSFFGEHLGGSR
jgi:carboxymethylenebutenolidase